MNLLSESVGADVLVAVAMVCGLLAGIDWLTSIAWGLLAGLVGAGVVQAARMLPAPAPDPHAVNLLGTEVARDEETADESVWEDDESWTPFTVCLAAVVMPFVGAYLVIRLAMLYVVPLAIVLVGATVYDAGWVPGLAVGAVCVLVSIGHELAVVQPLARRYDVDLG